MTIKCEAMAETASTLQASDSNQALVVDDSSVKTIEFLRARLLSERAASKAARQQAQEIAEKVKNLNARLETEIENRKKAEAAMGKVYTILKAKGLAVDGIAVASTDLKDQLEREVSTLDDIKEMNKDPQDFPSCIMDPSIDKEVSPKPLENKDESTEKGMVEKRKHSTSEPHAGDSENGIVSKVDQTVGTFCDDRDASLYNVRNPDVVQADIKENFLLQNAAEHHHCQVQLAVTDKPVVYTDKNSTPDFKEDSHTSQNFDQGSPITLKLKAMLHQIEEEVAALPKEQPLKLELQGWVDHVAGVLDKEKEAGLNGGLEMHTSDSKAGTNYPLKEATVFKTKSFTHSERPILLTEKEKAVALNQIHDIPEGQDTTEEMGKTLSIVRKEMLQQTNMGPPSTNYNGEFPSTMYPPTGKDPALPTKMFHNRRSSYDSLHFLQEPPKMPMHPQMMQYGVSQTSVAHSPMFANGYTANGHFTGAEAPYLVESQSPRSSDVFSVGDGALQVGYGHGQWCEARSQGRGLGLERQAGYREDALKRQCDTWSQAGLGSREILSSPYIVDVSNELHMKQEKYLDPRNIQHERGHPYPHRTYMHPVRDAAELNMNCNSRHPKSLPLSDATLSLMDDRNGRLGDILIALDAARQHVNDEEQSLYAEEQLIGPPTPTVEDARFNRGYHYGEDMQQVSYEYLNHTWRSRARTQTPIIQFPPSPASEHGYSPFERHGRHRRSSSVSTNFMMSGWESYLQPRGEVQLGNGITLYTD